MINKTTAEMALEDVQALVDKTAVVSEGAGGSGAKGATRLIDPDAFAKLNSPLPLAKKPWMKPLVIGAVSLVLGGPILYMFAGNMTVHKSETAPPAENASGVTASEESRAQAAEITRLTDQNARLMRDMGLAEISLDQSEMDALDAESASETDLATDTTTDRATAETTATASDSPPSQSAQPVPPVQPASTPIVRSPPASPVASRPPVQPAPRPAPARIPPPVRPQPVAVPTVSVPELDEDPYELRQQLSELGNYGHPVALAAPESAAPPVSRAPKSLVTTPHDVRATSPASAQSVSYREPIAQVPVSEPVPAEGHYYEDAVAVLGLPMPNVNNSPQPAAIAILPGETFPARLINGTHWREGERPEVALETTADFTVGDRILIPRGTRMLATIGSIDDAGGTQFEITQIFMNEALYIPPGSLAIQAADGSTLRASRSSQGGGTDLSATAWSSALNALGNVIESDDSLVGDLAGGVGEAVLENQRARVTLAAAQRSAVMNAEASVWTLPPRDVQIFVSRYISLEESYED